MANKFLTIDSNGFHKLVNESEAVVDFVVSTSYEEKQVVLDAVTNKMYRVSIANYTSDATDIQNDITANKLTLIGGSEFSYTNPTPVVQSLGGINAGHVFNGESLDTILNELLFPYVAPSVSLATAPVSALKEFGDTIPSVSLSATTVKKSNLITSVEFLRNGVSINTVASPNATGGAETYSDSVLVNSDTSYTVKVGDGTTFSTSNAQTFSFVYPMYVGSVLNTPNEAEIKAMTKLVQKKADVSKTYTFTGQKFCIAYVQSYGNLTAIKDTNLFEILGDFQKTTVTMTMLDGQSVVYNVYTSNNLADATNFTVQYKF